MRAELLARGAGLLLVVAGLAGCTDSAAVGPPPADRDPQISSYAALGDSFTAAPFVPETDLAGGCFRSSGNYPSLLAGELDIPRLRDASCSGATSADLTAPQLVAGGRGRVAAQATVLNRRNELVTVGVGGNDENLFSTIVRQCTRLAQGTGAPCLESMRDRWGNPERVLERTSARVAEALRAVQRRAPDARVVLVGYPRLVDPARPCRLMPLAPGDLDPVASLERALRDALAGAAQRTGSDFVDMYSLSRGHEICSDDPWVNGLRTDPEQALAYHPFAAEQQAVADAVAELLRADGP